MLVASPSASAEVGRRRTKEEGVCSRTDSEGSCGTSWYLNLSPLLLLKATSLFCLVHPDASVFCIGRLFPRAPEHLLGLYLTQLILLCQMPLVWLLTMDTQNPLSHSVPHWHRF